MLIRRLNVEREIEEKDFHKFELMGYVKVGVSKSLEAPANAKPLSKMNVSELKAKALELGINVNDSLTKGELLALVKGE